MTIATGFSQLLPVKNIDLVIRACKEAKIDLWIVGDGGEIERLKKIADNSVKFWGRLPNDQARVVMRKADAFVLFSSHEGMPHAVLEAIAEKVPVILSDIPAHQEIVTDGESGILVESGSVKKLTQAIIKLMADRVLRNKLVTNGYKVFCAQFTWEKHLRSLLDTFDSIVGH